VLTLLIAFNTFVCCSVRTDNSPQAADFTVRTHWAT